MPTFTHHSRIPLPAAVVFDWHTRPGALQRLLPPWRGIRLIRQEGNLAAGQVEWRLPGFPLGRRFVTTFEAAEFEPSRQFVERQVHGPFAAWRHRHRIEPTRDDNSACDMIDAIDYGLSRLTRLFGASVSREFAREFRFRHQRLINDLTRHQQFLDHGSRRMVISGASGLIGTQLVPYLTSAGHRVDRLIRGTADGAGTNGIRWNPATGEIDAVALNGVEAVIHLSGANVGRPWWTTAYKRDLLASRVETTMLLATTLARLPQKPKVLIVASGDKFYPSSETAAYDESGPKGQGFMADLVRAWEAAAEPARQAGIRVVHLRMGIVIGRAGGALAAMLPAFQMCAGATLGSGRQWWSWIALDDVLAAIEHLIFTEHVVGPVNVASPNVVTNREFTHTLARVLRRPAPWWIPALALRLGAGEMARHTLLASQRLVPTALLDSGFHFTFPTLEAALRFELGC